MSGTRRPARRRSVRNRPVSPWWALLFLGLVVLLVASPALLVVAAFVAALGAGGVLAWRRLPARPPAETARALLAVTRERDGLAAELARARAAATEAREHSAAELGRELAGTRAALEGARAAHADCPGRLAEAERRATDAEARAQDAEQSAHAAWDAAASDVPRCRFCRRPLDEDGACPRWCDEAPPEPRRRLLADPLSGARPLIGDDS
jgi:hypothetical protein